VAKKRVDKKEYGDRVVATNRRARHDYELLDGTEAGMQLIGSEVRALRENGGDLSEAWVDFNRGQAWLKGMRIPMLKHAAFAHEEKRNRKLLLHRAQIETLRGSVEREGLTLIATKCYFKDGRAKVEICLARGKKQHDKRHAIKARDADREARAAISRGRKG
jgi:SsrA-binding protein